VRAARLFTLSATPLRTTYDLEDLAKIASMSELGAIARGRALATGTVSMWFHCSIGRGDDVCLFHLADLVKPSPSPAVGEPALAVVACRQLPDQHSCSCICSFYLHNHDGARAQLRGLSAPCFNR
jgi:hypothetical protein